MEPSGERSLLRPRRRGLEETERAPLAEGPAQVLWPLLSWTTSSKQLVEIQAAARAKAARYTEDLKEMFRRAFGRDLHADVPSLLGNCKLAKPDGDVESLASTHCNRIWGIIAEPMRP